MEQAVILEHFVQNALTLSSLCCALHALGASGVTRRSVWVTGIGGGGGSRGRQTLHFWKRLWRGSSVTCRRKLRPCDGGADKAARVERAEIAHSFAVWKKKKKEIDFLAKLWHDGVIFRRVRSRRSLSFGVAAGSQDLREFVLDTGVSGG